MPKTKLLTQHVQESSESISPAEISQTPWYLKHLLVFRRIKAAVASARQSPPPQSMQPVPMAMSDLLAGRFREDVSRHSLPHSKPETKPSPGEFSSNQTGKDTALPDQRARLFARLGIRSEETHASIEDIDKLIASLSHIDEQQRRDAAHTIADLYESLPPEKQMHARINLILMTWRDANAYARIAAIKALARTKTPDTSAALQVSLRDEEQDVRAAAARALGEIGGKTPIVALISAAQRENEHWSVRAAALRTMGQSGERAFLNTITRALDEYDDAAVRIAAIHALAQLEGIQAAPRLALIAKQDRQLHVKHAAILELEDLNAGADERLM